jgi:hypothetical protein
VAVSSWRDEILKEFTPKVARLTLVADPDALLLEEGMLPAIKEKGFELVILDDPLLFRFEYQSRFRRYWDRKENQRSSLIVRVGSDSLETLPFDLLQSGRKLFFSLGELFPNLSYPVICHLDRAVLDPLYEAQVQYNPDKLGDNATKDFVLRHVYQIAPELIKQPPDLLRVLLRRHYHGYSMPQVLDHRFISILRQNRLFKEWPLEKIIQSRDSFIGFLQERWPAFLDRLSGIDPEDIKERFSGAYLTFEGPLEIPFDHDDIRVYVDSLFLEGILKPVRYPGLATIKGNWFSAGIESSAEEDRVERLQRLFDVVTEAVPSAEASHREWTTFAWKWAELLSSWVAVDKSLPASLAELLREVRDRVDAIFTSWAQTRYAGLHYQPPYPPVMVHHIPRALTRFLTRAGKEKVALIVIDGLALDQWIVMRDVLLNQDNKFRFDENAVFAWIPSVTSVCRQAIFAGKPPLYFAPSIYGTDKEQALWVQFWAEQGLLANQVACLKGIDDDILAAVKDILPGTQLRAIGVVINKVDRIMHGMELGAAGMHNQVRQWAEQGDFAAFLDLLHKAKFRTWIVSDHGNIDAVGCGRPAEGAMANVRGERVRIYPTGALRRHVKQSFDSALEWPPIGLPEDFLPLVAGGRTAFIQAGHRTVTHGGISLEELVVPFVEIGRRTN